MAQRRMFSLQVIDTDRFLNLPAKARLLYYELGMRADDDGFVASPIRIRMLIGCEASDLEHLIEKGFLLEFDSGVMVIRHWLLNNQIRTDRYRPTIYEDEYRRLTVVNNIYYFAE